MPLKPLASGIGPLRTALPLALISQMYRYKVYIEVDPQRCRFGSRKSDFALQVLVECRALEPKCFRLFVCVYYCSTYYKAVRVGGGGQWRTCATRDDEPRPLWTSLPITH